MHLFATSKRLGHIRMWVASLPLLLLAALFFALRVVHDDPRPTPELPTSAAKDDVDTLASAIDSFHTDTGNYPLRLNDLVTRPTMQAGWRDPYIAAIPLDPWQHPYCLLYPGPRGKPFDVASDGADGRAGTEDDITHHKLWPVTP